MSVGRLADYKPFPVVHKGVHDSAHEDSGDNIKYGMLLDEHR